MKSNLGNLSCVLVVLCLPTLYILYLSYIRNANVLGWSRNTTRLTSQYIFMGKMTANIMPEHICDKPSLVLVIVCSATPNFEARKAIRETWASKESLEKHNMSLYFLVGETENVATQKNLFLESYYYNDIIQENFVDSYNNLTLKSIQMVKIASSLCMSTTKYLLKIDDDIFLHVPNLMNLIVEKNTTKNLIIGRRACKAKPVREPWNKWFCPEYMFQEKEYPHYVMGAGYLMSIDVTKKLFQISLSTPIFHIEDIYLTGICSRKANIKPQNDFRFTVDDLKDNYCENMHNILMHNFGPLRMKQTFKMFNDPEVINACGPRHFVNTSTWLLYKTFLPTGPVRKDKCI